MDLPPRIEIVTGILKPSFALAVHTHLPRALSWLGALHDSFIAIPMQENLRLHAANHRASQCCLPPSVLSLKYDTLIRFCHLDGAS